MGQATWAGGAGYASAGKAGSMVWPWRPQPDLPWQWEKATSGGKRETWQVGCLCEEQTAPYEVQGGHWGYYESEGSICSPGPGCSSCLSLTWPGAQQGALQEASEWILGRSLDQGGHV